MTTSIRGGMSACAGLCGDSWYGGALVHDTGDEGFLAVAQDGSFEERAAHCQTWAELTTARPRTLCLLQPAEGGMGVTTLRAAERIEGPVCPPETVEQPVLAWVERREGRWHLMLWQGSAPMSVLARPQVLRCPHVALTAGGLRLAFEYDTGPFSTAVDVVDPAGRVQATLAGRAPLLVGAGEGFVLATEQASPNAVTLRLSSFASAESTTPDAATELQPEDLCLNADIGWNGTRLVIAAESCPALGQSNQIGLHRTICIWSWDLQTEPQPLGSLPVEQRAFKSIGMENIPPIRPAVFFEDGAPVIHFKQHRFTGFRGFGWDIFRCRQRESGWHAPERITPDTTTSDTGFGLVQVGGDWLGLFPAHENLGGNGSQQSRNHRVDLVTVTGGLETVAIPEEKRGNYRIPARCVDIALDPPMLAPSYAGRQLIWGDLHIHTIYSKCVSAVDGDPRENIRFARDVLGCRVFAFAEHTMHTTGVESVWTFDQLESTAGNDNVILYATEPGIHRTRHMNLYARDRNTFERLERILLAQKRRYPEVLRQLREDLPHDSVFVMRHVHGEAIPEAQILQHFDPHFEVAMEAMQGRGNAMLEEAEGSSLFPQPFLNAGCKVGLVGGTDHFREWAPNHFCLTGFWVKEVSADGVWEAIRNRYTIAMSNARTAMLTRCQGWPMGSSVTVAEGEPFRMQVQVSSAHGVRRVCLMRDGEMLPWVEVNATAATVELTDETMAPGRHWVVATAEVNTGYDNPGICHASPTFVWKES